jgi:hypothetical protein
LSELEPLTRLLFAGLWTIADREGRLLDRPRKIKAEVLPYDEYDVGSGLAQLEEHGFIRRYAVAGVCCIQIVNWSKHQSPHPREAPSELPAPPHQHGRAEPRPGNGLATARQRPGRPNPLIDRSSGSGSFNRSLEPRAARPRDRPTDIEPSDTERAQLVDKAVAFAQDIGDAAPEVMATELSRLFDEAGMPLEAFEELLAPVAQRTRERREVLERPGAYFVASARTAVGRVARRVSQHLARAPTTGAGARKGTLQQQAVPA